MATERHYFRTLSNMRTMVIPDEGEGMVKIYTNTNRQFGRDMAKRFEGVKGVIVTEEYDEEHMAWFVREKIIMN